LAKLNIKGTGNCGKEDDGSIQENGASDSSASNVIDNPYSSRDLKASTSHHCTNDTEDNGEIPHTKNSSFATGRAHSNAYGHSVASEFKNSSVEACSRECTECFGLSRPGDPLPRLHCQSDVKELEPEVSNLKALEIEHEMQRQPDNKHFLSSGESIGSHGSSSSKGDNESNSIVDCEIGWEDLHFGEEVGQGILELLIFI
jgi:hypothetical protein